MMETLPSATNVPEIVDSVHEPPKPQFKQYGSRSFSSGRRASYILISKTTENNVRIKLWGGSNGSFISSITQLDPEADVDLENDDSFQAHLDRRMQTNSNATDRT
mmetsp:Transcript_564/g.951  ORF Transcript_564/g.951 Transcript_564/m.951 type:complete len:105 (+) Transcript_564:254-568(+)